MKVIRPHKAENAIITDLRFPAIVLPKIDGVRGLKISQYFTGRTLKTFRNSYVTDQFSDPMLHGLDGELCFGDYTAPDLCRKTTSYLNSYASNTSNVLPDWYVFDFIAEEVAHLVYKKRYEMLRLYVNNLKEKNPEQYHFLRLIPDDLIFECYNTEEVEAAHSLYISAGFEGTIIRYNNAPHKNGRSTVSEGAYMRIKDFIYEEATVIAIEEAETNYNTAERNALGYIERSSAKDGKAGNGMIGSLVVRRADGSICNVGPGKLTHTERADYFESPFRIIGKVITFKHMKYGSKDKPRFATFENFRLAEDM